MTVLLQVHVIKEPAYDLLLGRPFDALLQTHIQNFADGRQIITLTEPLTNRRITVPTFARGFSSNLEDLIRKDQGEVAIVFEVKKNGEVEIDSYCLPPKKKFTYDGLRNAYLVASVDATAHDKHAQHSLSSYLSSVYSMDIKTPGTNISTASTAEPMAVLASRKYKPVAKKVRPIIGELPQKFRIIRDIKGDPLKDMPKLSTHPPEFKPTGRYTEARKAIIDKI
ncbi:uncharacterized protein C8R40DRAFT_1061721, partial [Lentinula edodes]|uniref:uncharacterized protein n=1 Tax=Lentinula edodes TaxID=5353 RepID=UPI001E8D3FE9